MKIIVGLGNPTPEYEHTRHNIGRDVVEKFRKKHKFEGWEFDKKSNALVTEGKIGKEKVLLMLPETYMNDSGLSVMKYVKNKKQAQNTMVVHDELDLGVGSLKVSFNKNSGGQKGVESIIKKIKTKEFGRLRFGIAPMTPTGIVKKVRGEDKVKKHVLGKFTAKEEALVKKRMTRALQGLELFIEQNHVVMANRVNSGGKIK
jgi:PTH1 family peptidyl-tRNA hydrolase